MLNELYNEALREYENMIIKGVNSLPAGSSFTVATIRDYLKKNGYKYIESREVSYLLRKLYRNTAGFSYKHVVKNGANRHSQLGAPYIGVYTKDAKVDMAAQGHKGPVHIVQGVNELYEVVLKNISTDRLLDEIKKRLAA